MFCIQEAVTNLHLNRKKEKKTDLVTAILYVSAHMFAPHVCQTEFNLRHSNEMKLGRDDRAHISVTKRKPSCE